VDVLYAYCVYKSLGTQANLGKIVPLLLGYFIERDPSSRYYHLHSGSSLLNEATNYGEFDLFGGYDLQQFMMVCLEWQVIHTVMPWLFCFMGLAHHISGSKFTMPYAGSY
jgi:hypothetical protein